MEDKDQYKEICDLLMFWGKIHYGGLVWPQAKRALEGRINILCKRDKLLLGDDPLVVTEKWKA